MEELKIKGTADFSAITKSADRLSKTLNDSFSKDGKVLFDKESMDFAKRESVSALMRMRDLMGRLTDEASKLDAQLQSSNLTEEKHNQLLEDRMQNLERIASLRRRMGSMESFRDGMLGDLSSSKVIDFEKYLKRKDEKSFGKEATQGVQKIASNLPGVGGASSVIGDTLSAGKGAFASGGVLGALGFAGLAATVGTTILAVSRLKKGFDEFSAQLPRYLEQISLGISPTDGRGAALLGFGAQDAFQTQIGLARSFGTKSGQAGENRLNNTLAASRTLGIDPSQITGMGDRLRASVGGELAEQSISRLLSTAISTGMDRSQATHYLETATNLLADVNKSGVMDSSVVTGLLANLTKMGLAPEQAARSVSGLNSAISNSQGEANVFFQLAAGRRGLGGGTLGGGAFAVQQGLLGVDQDAYMNQSLNKGAARQDLSDFKAMGLLGPQFTQEFAKGILQQLDDVGFDQDTLQGRMGRRSFISQQFGSTNLADTRRIEDVLQKLASGEGLNPQDQKIIKDLGKSQEQKWQDEALRVLRGIEGNTSQTMARESFRMQALGKEGAPLFNTLTDTMGSLDTTITEATAEINKLVDRMFPDKAGGLQEIEESTGLRYDEKTKQLNVADPDKLKQSMTPEKIEQIKKLNEEFNNRGFFDSIKEIFTGANAPAVKSGETVAGVSPELLGILQELTKQTKLLEKAHRGTLPQRMS